MLCRSSVEAVEIMDEHHGQQRDEQHDELLLACHADDADGYKDEIDNGVIGEDGDQPHLQQLAIVVHCLCCLKGLERVGLEQGVCRQHEHNDNKGCHHRQDNAFLETLTPMEEEKEDDRIDDDDVDAEDGGDAHNGKWLPERRLPHDEKKCPYQNQGNGSGQNYCPKNGMGEASMLRKIKTYP